MDEAIPAITLPDTAEIPKAGLVLRGRRQGSVLARNRERELLGPIGHRTQARPWDAPWRSHNPDSLASR